jgi:hypothetical protein
MEPQEAQKTETHSAVETAPSHPEATAVEAPAVEAPAEATTEATPVAEAYEEAPAEPPVGPRVYPSLYDSTGTTLAAIVLGMAIVAAVQYLTLKLYSSAKGEHVYLTRFVTSLVALIVGAYLADLLIAGPDTSLLSDADHTLILTFVKDTCLMVFSYYFGLKAQAPREDA